MKAIEHSDKATLQAHVEATTRPDASVNTDEWKGYNDGAKSGRTHRTVNHSPATREWARDDDGDGQCFVLRPDDRNGSPLDVPGINLGLCDDEIVSLVHEGRRSV